MDEKTIRNAMEAPVKDRGCFLVDVTVGADDDIVLTIESENGTVDMEDCVSLSRTFQEIFDREVEDYSLTVTSAGLDQPFKVLKQFLKAVGTQVEVRFKGGRKLLGTLTAADEESITLAYIAREAVEGKKKKVDVAHEDRFPLEGINSVTPHIDFE